MVFGPLSWVVMPDLIRHPGLWELREAWIPDLPLVFRNDERSVKPYEKELQDETSDKLPPDTISPICSRKVCRKIFKRHGKGEDSECSPSPEIAKALIRPPRCASSSPVGYPVEQHSQGRETHSSQGAMKMSGAWPPQPPTNWRSGFFGNGRGQIVIIDICCPNLKQGLNEFIWEADPRGTLWGVSN